MIPAFLAPLLGPLMGALSGAIKSVFPDSEDELKRLKIEQEIHLALLSQSSAIEAAAGEIVKAEAQSQFFLVAAWRPVLMLVFGGLIVARWFGWASPGLTEAEALKLWTIVEWGLGGYVAGRSLEKIVPDVAKAVISAKGTK